ncbi:MAG: hypothetical protein IJE43_19055 [Alphaproteobacteria bacterium]|nr:hypothetical protein [Alphaproteobacteria bacterium]
MIIAIKSEIDSRVLLYPLMKACDTFGSVLVLTDNRYVRRVIDDVEYGTFKNITIIVDEECAADDLYETYGVSPGDYDYIILDNIGAAEYDKCFWLFGYKQSEVFLEDKKIVEESERADNLVYLEYGKPVNSNKPAQKVVSKRGKVEDNQEVPEGYDPAEKFRNLEEEEHLRVVAKYNLPFPSFEYIENIEGRGIFGAVDEKLCKVFYDIFGTQLNIQFNIFRKEIRQTNESSGNNKSGRSSR